MLPRRAIFFFLMWHRAVGVLPLLRSEEFACYYQFFLWLSSAKAKKKYRTLDESCKRHQILLQSLLSQLLLFSKCVDELRSEKSIAEFLLLPFFWGYKTLKNIDQVQPQGTIKCAGEEIVLI